MYTHSSFLNARKQKYNQRERQTERQRGWGGGEREREITERCNLKKQIKIGKFKVKL